MLTTFPSKVLLLGEYTILSGSKAIALPYYAFQGAWSFDKTESEARESSRKSLLSFIEKSNVTSVDLARMRKDYEDGIWFDSSIPQGFGLGSSGAIIAAIYQKYGNPVGVIEEDKFELARLEDFFHGSSSGLDPLLSHIQKPLLIHSFNEVEILKESPSLKGFFLVNTGKPRQTGPLVNIYQEKMKDPEFKKGCAEILAREVDFAIDALLKGDQEILFHHLWHISKFQWDFFPEMIPTRERALWSKGLETGDYVLKLCGAGGGGFILGHSKKLSIEEIRDLLSTHELRALD